MANNKNEKFRLPAEWEQQSGIMIVWPHADTDWAPYLADIEATYLQLASVVTSHERLLVAARYPDDVRARLGRRLTEEQMGNLTIRQCDSNDTWARDLGPITITAQGGAKRIADARLLDFRFNGWGEKFPSALDNAVTRKLYASGVFRGTLVDNSDFVLEGGALETDGRGTLFLTRSSQMAPHRNQPMTQDEIERRLLLAFGARRVVWIDSGHLIGDDTDGHIDTLVRCAPADTLLYVGCDDPADAQYTELQLMENQLAGLRTVEGKPYRLLRLPLPDAIYDGGERLPATYANFVIINGAVIVPTYSQPEKDRKAMEVIGSAFPRHAVIGVNSLTPIRQHGSLHCLTMHLPAGVIAEGAQ